MEPGVGATKRAISGCPGGGSMTPPRGLLAADGPQNRVARVVGLEDDQVADALEDLADEPVGRAVGKLDHDRSVGQLVRDGPLLTQPPCPVRRDPYAGH